MAAAALPTRDLLRGLLAMGFSALMLDRNGYKTVGASHVRELRALLGAPIATRTGRLLAWDLRPAEASLLGNMNAAAKRALAQQMLDAPRLYLSTDAVPIVGRGDPQEICSSGSILLVNPGTRGAHGRLKVVIRKRQSGAYRGRVTINGRSVAIATGYRGNRIAVDIPPGTTRIKISVKTPGVRCAAVPLNALPITSAELR